MNKKAPFISTQVTSGEYFYLNLAPDKSMPETVVCGGREQCSPDYLVERDHFKFHSIEFVSSGCGTLKLHDKTYPLRPGAIYYYGPRTKHTIKTDPEYPMLKYFVDFTGSTLTNLMRTTCFSEKHPLYVSQPFRIRSIFENFITTGNTESHNRNAICALLLRQLILLADDCTMTAASAFSPARQTYLRCRQYIERNYIEVNNINDVAEKCFVNRAYLSRLFKRFAKESPLQLLTRLKINKSADLLSAREFLIKEVAEKVGFSDPYHFSRVFKRVYGIPPETFTKSSRY